MSYLPLSITSINDRIPQMARETATGYRIEGCFFIIECAGGVEIFFNPEGKEIFRVTFKKKAWWKFWGR